jgi:replicative DNA helicase
MNTWSKEAEENVIGAILIDNSNWREVQDEVSASDFYDKRHQSIFTAMASMATGMMPIDVITVTEFLEKQGFNFGLAFVGEIAQSVVTTTNVKAYAEIVREYSKRRKFYTLIDKLKGEAFNKKSDIDSLISTAQEGLVNLSRETQKSELVSIQKVATEYIAELEERTKNGSFVGLSTGYDDIDENINGMREGNLIVVAARPGVGKSTFALNVCENLASEGKKVLILSLEMTNSELVEKSFSSQGRVSYTKLLNGSIRDHDDWEKVFAGGSKIREQQIMMCDKESLTTQEITKLAWDARDRMGGLDAIMVDYIQLAEGVGRSRTEQVGQVSKGLKSLAKQLGVSVIALAQLNRDIEKRSDPKPKMSDLRESGSIEQDADVVLFLHREDETDITQVITGKARKGKKNSEALLVFRGDNQRFDNADESAWGELEDIKQSKIAPKSFQPKKSMY